MDCIFCKIISGDVPSYKIYEDENILAFLDVNPTSVGHTLIVPKAHILDVMEIDNDSLLKIFDKARDIANLLREKLGASGFTLIQNNGIAQEVKHFHLHVIPKYNKKINMRVEDVYKKLTN